MGRVKHDPAHGRPGRRDGHRVRIRAGVHLDPAVTGADAVARSWARKVNEFAAELVKDHPDRFGFFATLTLPDVEGAIAEAEYAFDVLGADGVILLANAHGTYLGDATFDPLFDALNERA